MTTKKPKRLAKRSPRTSTLIRETLDWMHIAERCVEFADDCWLWTGATASKNPIVKMPGRPCMTVRRVVLEMDGRAPAPRQPCTTTCNEPLCVNPAHVVASTVKAIGKKAAKRGAWSTPGRIAKITATKRKSSRLMTMELARTIRQSTDRLSDVAAQHGLKLSHVKVIRLGRIWKDHASPFAGLGQRA